jgi:hypothetical protein
MLKRPADPRLVARAIGDQPLQVEATIHDFGDLVDWMQQFHEELQAVLHEQRERRGALKR